MENREFLGDKPVLKALSKTRLSKKEREKKVLLGLVDAYIESSQPIGSKTLKESLFHDLSSATIRNYFAALEDAGYLSQQHASGGRAPTEKAFQAYAEEYLRAGTLDENQDKQLKQLEGLESKEVGSYLQRASEILSELVGYPAFISSPRFDQDSITDIKLVTIDASRCLCVVVTELGLIHTETLYLNKKLHLHALKRIEDALLFRVKGQGAKPSLDKSEDLILQQIYNEVMVRYIIGYANFSSEDLYKTGLSRLLIHPEFSSADSFASGLSIFESEEHLHHLLRDSTKDAILKFYIGSELSDYCPLAENCGVIVMPYKIGGKIVGAVGLLGPMRMPYRELFGVLRAFTDYVGQTLSNTISKHELSYRLPQDGSLYLEDKNAPKLIENQSN
ncbi:MAG: Heat-inducible transcription repressor HrcA [Chlamydiae bacterium]|nr:Heat-inducible transcription repressor HrcA [Chlamydiota bacterium]